ncbi:hypothetical protein [Thiocystis violacea]|uniref:hypothetical protein n=1 Tax=Thiocystis violacea TaxID=13725 RepID=UPI0019052BE6|nr:hypothetical protein [Thiocystis violacea]
MRYWTIRYEGRDLMRVWVGSARQAQESAVRTYQGEGRRGMNLARLEVILPDAFH